MIDYIKRNKVVLGITIITVALLYYFVSGEKSEVTVGSVETTAEESSTSSVNTLPKSENAAIVESVVPTIEAVPVKLDEAKTEGSTAAVVVEKGTITGDDPQSVSSGCGESVSGESETVKTVKMDSVVKATEQPATVKSAVSTTTEDK